MEIKLLPETKNIIDACIEYLDADTTEEYSSDVSKLLRFAYDNRQVNNSSLILVQEYYYQKYPDNESMILEFGKEIKETMDQLFSLSVSIIVENEPDYEEGDCCFFSLIGSSYGFFDKASNLEALRLEFTENALKNSVAEFREQNFPSAEETRAVFSSED